ncbi:MAG: ferrochelatase [Alphaproteobacteria bacterium]|nr:ferrochelatase [Alphaproteobacteria bacterium]
MSKTAVVLLNLGGPDSKEAIAPFLKNFFMDKNIVRLPLPFRFMLSRLIAWRRSRKEAGNSYAALGNKSPLLENSEAQAKALEAALNGGGTGQDYKCFIAMRYWHPFSSETAKLVQDYAPDRVILLPLYPQYSTTTTRSSFQEWVKTNITQNTSLICCYPFDDGFITASVENIKRIYESAQKDGHENIRVLFSAHGLPESIIKDGDPYQWQCEESARKIVQALEDYNGGPRLDWQVCYQSRVGAQKWIGPSTEEALEKAAHDKVSVVIYPHAFVSEHVETLVEIEEEYREIAEKMGIHGFYRVPTVMTHPAFIEGLRRLVKKHEKEIGTILPPTGYALCPPHFRRCACRDNLVQGLV